LRGGTRGITSMVALRFPEAEELPEDLARMRHRSDIGVLAARLPGSHSGEPQGSQKAQKGVTELGGARCPWLRPFLVLCSVFRVLSS
jgi:hypothetical protein